MRKIAKCLSTPSVGYANSRSLKFLESLSTLSKRQRSHRDNLRSVGLRQSFSIERKAPLKFKDEERRNCCFVQKEILSPPGKGKKRKGQENTISITTTK